MNKLTLLLSLVFISNVATAKTVSDFINEYPALAKNPIIKVAIQQGAMGNAATDAVSNGATEKDIVAVTQRLLADNGYDYARASLRDLAGNICGTPELADVYSLRDKDCQTINEVDSDIQ
ncbi:hypothetical protein EH227_24940 [Rouxiella chamberiensis]|nr:hypothetical protein EH227_24940 [Rouxiella chamberiensis]